MRNSEKPSILSPLFIHLFILNFITLLGYMVLSLIPPYLTEHGATKMFVGFFMNVPAFALLMFVLLFSRFTNQFNRRFFLVFGNIIFTISLVCMFFVADNIWLLLFFRMVSSVSFAFAFTMHMSLVYDVLPASRRAGGIAFFGISGLLTSPLGSVLAEMIIAHHHPRWLFLVAAICGLTAAVVAALIKQPVSEQSSERPVTVWGVLGRSSLLSLILVTIIFGGIFSIFISFIPDYTLIVLGRATLSYFFIPYAGMAVTARLLFSGVLHHFSAIRLIRIAMFLSALAMVFFIKLVSVWQIAAVGLMYGAAHAILFPCLSATFVDRAQPGEKAVYNSTFLSLLMSGSVIFPALLGLVGDRVATGIPGRGFQVIFGGMVVVILAGFILSFYIRSPQKK